VANIPNDQAPSLSGLALEGKTRTSIDCHQCGKTFIANLDFHVDGNHVVECPRCGHEHCRTIKKGVVTSERWDGRANKVQVERRDVWTAPDQAIITSTASAYLRELWLNKDGGGHL
jgi:DNA-directed RNA polymerase subunit RPC12/RpoP